MIEEAATVPSFCVAPRTTTVWPGCTDVSLVVTVFVTVEPADVVTLTVFPLESVT